MRLNFRIETIIMVVRRSCVILLFLFAVYTMSSVQAAPSEPPCGEIDRILCTLDLHPNIFVRNNHPGPFPDPMHIDLQLLRNERMKCCGES